MLEKAQPKVDIIEVYRMRIANIVKTFMQDNRVFQEKALSLQNN